MLKNISTLCLLAFSSVAIARTVPSDVETASPSLEIALVVSKMCSPGDNIILPSDCLYNIRADPGVNYTSDGKITVPSGTKNIIVTINGIHPLQENMNLYLTTIVSGDGNKKKQNSIGKFTPSSTITPIGDVYVAIVTISHDVDSIYIDADIDSSNGCHVGFDSILIEFV